MSRYIEENQHAKISDGFAHRLAMLPPNQRVRAVVLPAPYMVTGVTDNRDSGRNGARVHGDERQAMVREARLRGEGACAELDAVLAKTGGERLSGGSNALGFIVVETTAAGISAIADLDWVGVVLEDQAIRPVHQTGSHPPH